MIVVVVGRNGSSSCGCCSVCILYGCGGKPCGFPLRFPGSLILGPFPVSILHSITTNDAGVLLLLLLIRRFCCMIRFVVAVASSSASSSSIVHSSGSVCCGGCCACRIRGILIPISCVRSICICSSICLLICRSCSNFSRSAVDNDYIRLLLKPIGIRTKTYSTFLARLKQVSLSATLGGDASC